MTPDELRQARTVLGLTYAQAAVVLETDISTIKKMERDSSRASSRGAPVRVPQLYRAYLGGFRPANWPQPMPDDDDLI